VARADVRRSVARVLQECRLVPSTVTRSRVTSCHSASSRGCTGEPSYSTISTPLARADSCQFHIIQAHVV